MSFHHLTLMRHGSIADGGRLTGSTDLPLDATGERQMARAWLRIAADLPVTALASSPMLRCAVFAREMAARQGLVLHEDAGFAEYGFGAWEGMDAAALNAAHPGWGARLAAGTFVPPGAVSHAAFRDRVQAAMDGWMAMEGGSHRVLVTHGGVITALLMALLQTDFGVASHLVVPRGGFVRLAVQPGERAWVVGLEGACAD